MATLRRDAERNRRRILEAAREGFARRGLGITLDEIARLAGVGVGTVYRRFPNKEQLIDALFEDRIGEVAALAETTLEDEDAWRGIATFLEGAVALLASDRGLRELVLGSKYRPERVTRARSRIKPLVERLVERAQSAGALRDDMRATDFPLILFMLDAVVDSTRDVDPETWRRALAIVLDGLAARRDAPTPLPGAALDDEQLDAAMRAWRP
ncbi:TetR/AcrR family transcriptional regulator [Candidatus Solirubrobacter pratensis]|uniref:TetR/AcrR family transcriptional regulator n=1 Tax=Candidatus Solirubrobacter pratensis TaxID=1298857 RepID=UPI0003F75674|nr:TetR/AcrR family transcriptional regulator [Candidatus Solirubrobacter pratensis]